jgi:hypothetical protein
VLILRSRFAAPSELGRLTAPGWSYLRDIVAPVRFWLIEVNEGVAHEATAVWRNCPEVGVTLG